MPKSLLDHVPDHSLTVFDKGFFSASLLLQLHRNGQQHHRLIPAKANTTGERLDANPSDYRLRMKVSPQARETELGFDRTTTRHGKRRILLTSLMATKGLSGKRSSRQNGGNHAPASSKNFRSDTQSKPSASLRKLHDGQGPEAAFFILSKDRSQIWAPRALVVASKAFCT